MFKLGVRACAALVIAMAAASTILVAAAGPESRRLGRAKDYMADEQWSRAIEELRVAVADAGEKNKDEALYWLAHSLNQAGDAAAAIETIRRLERDFPSSLWVKPAGSLRLDIAIHMRREDVLWWTAVSPPPPAAAPPPVPPTPDARPPAKPRRPAAAPTPAPTPPPVAPSSVEAPPPPAWLPDDYRPDTDLRIQALGSLIRTDAHKVIPILRKIALEADNPADARRAVFVLAQSGRPEARATVVQVAKTGPEPVRIAAVRELGRFGGVDISNELLQVYDGADLPVKRQVVTSLGERRQKLALVRIAESEKDPHLRESAIVMLGQAGGEEQLRVLYGRASSEVKRAIIVGLFNARAEEDLIRIAEQERDPKLRAAALMRLRLMGTVKAREYLQKVSRNR